MVAHLGKYLAIGGGVLMMLHLLLSVHPVYRSKTSPFSYIPSEWAEAGMESAEDLYDAFPMELSGSNSTGWMPPTLEQLIRAGPKGRRKANAVFVVLVRNEELWGMLASMKQMEDRFNIWAKYDYVFLNDEPFTEEFQLRTQSLTSSTCHYGLIDPLMWNQPDWINEDRAAAGRQLMASKGMPYANSVSYRNMCRFESGYFFRHPLLADYEYYWRLEPGVELFCDITYDPFLLMMDENKVYGFTIALLELAETIPTLWDTVKDFIREHPEYIVEGNAEKFITTDGFKTYNRCHFWSNFEIGDLNFWRSDAYMTFFEHLEQSGGFYYERWGDAPIHSIAAALLAKKEQIHYFRDIGYRHDPFQHCPADDEQLQGKCWCDSSEPANFDWTSGSCLNIYLDMMGQ